MKLLRCIKDVPIATNSVTDVTIGKIYEQADDYDDCDDYYIRDDTGKIHYYEKQFFEVVVAELVNYIYEDDICPNCKIELKTGYVSDVTAGDVLVSFNFDYCPNCLYRGESKVTNIST